MIEEARGNAEKAADYYARFEKEAGASPMLGEILRRRASAFAYQGAAQAREILEDWQGATGSPAGIRRSRSSNTATCCMRRRPPEGVRLLRAHLPRLRQAPRSRRPRLPAAGRGARSHRRARGGGGGLSRAGRAG
ncbi:MAG: hypothetical protein R3F11_07060 [Verrucomicrobiales bacterium]